MSYEIPAELKYEEKIMFSLSIWQSLWLGLFSSAALIVFLKTTLPMEVKAAIACALLLLGAGFAFFGLKEKTLALLSFVSKPRQAGYFDKQMAGFMDVEKIEGDAVFMKGGAVKAIIQVQPMNFRMLSETHKQSVIAAYRDFLNSLDFPIQIAMRTIGLSMDDYLDRLELKARSAKDRSVYASFLEFRGFTRSYIRQKEAKNRMFYVVVPAGHKVVAWPGPVGRTEIESVAKSLDARVRACQEKLRNCNLFTKRLSTQELAALLGGYFDCCLDAKQDYFASVSSLEGGNNEPVMVQVASQPSPPDFSSD